MTAIWDEAFLRQRARDAREDALAPQSDDDWESAELLLERAMSDSCGGCIRLSVAGLPPRAPLRRQQADLHAAMRGRI